MNKKLKKILATVSAVAMCTVSATSLSSSALYIVVDELKNIDPYIYNGIPYYGVPIDTQSFCVKGVKYTRWEKGTEYFQKFCGLEPVLYVNDENKFYAVTDGYCATPCCPLTRQARAVSIIGTGMDFYLEKDEADILEKFLSENDINYTIKENYDDYEKNYIISFPEAKTWDDFIDIATPIYENTGLSVSCVFPELMIKATDFEIPLPEPTLSGDTNKDGKVSLADAVLIMQVLSNPDKYQLTSQGIANADMDGDGLTPSDALKIQQSILNS